MLFEIRIMSGQQYSTKDSTVYGEAEVPEPPGMHTELLTCQNPDHEQLVQSGAPACSMVPNRLSAVSDIS